MVVGKIQEPQKRDNFEEPLSSWYEDEPDVGFWEDFG
jgi:hypothetical protein